MNTQTKHTPGPWQIDPQCNWKVVSGYDADGDHELIAECGFIENAALIAQAPDLMRQRDRLREALKTCLQHSEALQEASQSIDGLVDGIGGRLGLDSDIESARAILAETEAA